MKSLYPFSDPFFDKPEKVYADTPADRCRQMRDVTRAASQMPALKFGYFIMNAMRLSLIWTPSFVAMTIVIATLTRSSGLRWFDLCFALAILVLSLLCIYYFWSRSQKIAKAIEKLANHHGGSWGDKRLTNILDWLDSHWPAEHPIEIAAPVDVFEHRWDWQSVFANRPVLLVVQRRRFGRSSILDQDSAVQRMSFFLAGSATSVDPIANSTSALEKVERLGFWVKRTNAGVFVAHSGIAVEKLDPQYVEKILQLATQIG